MVFIGMTINRDSDFRHNIREKRGRKQPKNVGAMDRFSTVGDEI